LNLGYVEPLLWKITAFKQLFERPSGSNREITAILQLFGHHPRYLNRINCFIAVIYTKPARPS